MVMNGGSDRSVIDFTAAGVEFAPWPTPVENDDLHLGKLSFNLGSPLVTYVQEGLTFALPGATTPQVPELEATFVSRNKGAVIRFGFDEVIAFRVLDEDALLELWDASTACTRPARTTFRTRGHAWTSESPLVFSDATQKCRFNYLVATNDWCLEVICRSEPTVEQLGQAIITEAKHP